MLRPWRAAFCAALLGCLLAPSPVLARWLRADSPRFTVYSDGDEKTLRREVETLETFDTFMRRLQGLDARGAPPRKLIVYLVRDIDAIRQISPKSAGIAGYYIASPDTVMMIASLEYKGEQTLLHEYTHHFMLQYFPYNYPSWLVEGIAEYYSTARIEAKSIAIGRYDDDSASFLMNGDWLPLEDVLTKRASAFKNNDMAMFYQQAWLLTHYFNSDPARGRMLSAYLEALNQGVGSVAAMEKATGEPIEQLRLKLRRYTHERMNYHVISFAGDPTPAVTVTTEPPVADAVLLVSERLRTGGCDAALLKKVRAALASYPDEPLAQRAAIRAERGCGDVAAADALLAKRLAADPKDVEALELSAQAEIARAEQEKDPDAARAMYRKAAALLLRANRAEPQRFQPLYLYALTKRHEPGYPSDNVLEGLLAAHDYAPQVDTVTLLTAEALIDRGQRDRAAKMLQPVANNPHGGDGADAAKAMLKSLEPAASPDSPSS